MGGSKHKRKERRRSSSRSRSESPDDRKDRRRRSRDRSPQRSRHRSRSRSPVRTKHKDSRYDERSNDHKKNKKSRRDRSSSDNDSDGHGRSRKRRSSSRSDDDSKRRKNKKKHRSSSSSSSSFEEDSRNKKKEKTHEKMLQLKRDKKKEYEVMKALETPEEKRARRLAKKDAKERKRKEQMGWDEEYMGYTNTDNPFGDEELLDNFVWGKKMEKEGIKHDNTKEVEEHQRRKREENKRELEKVKRRRLEREREMAERDNEREFLQRQKEAENFKEWEQQEDTFHLQQAKLRSQIRIDDGRAKPIDLLAKYVSAEDDNYAIEMQEPYSYLGGLTVEDLEDLLEDIKVYKELEQGKNVPYWTDITIIVDDELQRLMKMEAAARDELIRDRRQGINNSVVDDVSSVFKGKSHSQLELLERQVHMKLQGGEGVDVGYWESLLQQLRAHMALTRLRERHQENLRRKLFKLKEEQGIENQNLLFPIVKEDSPSMEGRVKDSPRDSPVPEPQPSGSTEDAMEEETNSPEATTRYDDYEQGNYTPKLLTPSDLEIDTVIYDPEDDMKKLEYMRRQVRATGHVKADTESEFIKKAKEGMNDDEAQFSVELNLEQQSFLWSDKYRPRKPRFFNRVHTGFEWNKYNQTHYDIDNPPPKIVQGYKFNIFYPDLIDKSQTPQYTLTPVDGEPDFAMLKFLAGPPYESIAFKVVNREWEYSWKRGFRCQFHNNIFQLWYHFKRYRYRR